MSLLLLLTTLVVTGQNAAYYKDGTGYNIVSTIPQWYQNLEKYWFYRYRLVNDFTFIGPNPGESLIAYRRNLGDFPGSDGWKQWNGLDFGADQTEDLGSYMGVLATEYEQLKQNGLSTARTLYEIKYAQNAYDRLRQNGLGYYDSMNAVPNVYPPTYEPLITTDVFSGFFIRDDVPPYTFLEGSTDPLNEYHYRHFNRPILTNSFPIASCCPLPYGAPLKNVERVNNGSINSAYMPTSTSPLPATYYSGTGSQPYPLVESMDQLQNIFLGEAQLIKYLTDTDPLVMYQRTRCQNALYHSMKSLEHHCGTPYLFWSIPNPNDGYGEYACATFDCSSRGYFYPSAFAAMHAAHNVLRGCSGCVGDANELMVNTENILAYVAYSWGESFSIDCGFLPTHDISFMDAYTTFGPAGRKWVHYFPFFALNWPLNYFHWLASTEAAKVRDSWDVISAHSDQNYFGTPHIPLIFQLNDHDRGWWDNSLLESQLNIAPSCGEWNYENSVANHNSVFGQDDYFNIHGNTYSSPNWSGNNWFTDPEHRQGIPCAPIGLFTFSPYHTQGYNCEFNGLDYMWLFNLYSIQRGQASAQGYTTAPPYLGGMMNSYYCEDFNVYYPDMSHGGIGSTGFKLKLNWLEYLSATNIISGSGGWVDYRGAQTIDLKPGFVAESGSFFYAHIKDYNCSGEDIGDGAYNFAEAGTISTIRPKHRDISKVGDSVIKITEWRPIMYLPYGDGYKANPLPKPDPEAIIADSILQIPGNQEKLAAYFKAGLLNSIKDSSIEIQNAIKDFFGIKDSIAYLNIPDSITVTLYPNPTDGKAYLSYHLSEAKNVKLLLSNALGQNFNYLVEQYDEAEQAGEHKINIDADKLVPGIYYVLIKIGDYLTTKKLTVY